MVINITSLKQHIGVARHLKSRCLLIRPGKPLNYAMNTVKIFTTVVSLVLLWWEFQRGSVSWDGGLLSDSIVVVCTL